MQQTPQSKHDEDRKKSGPFSGSPEEQSILIGNLPLDATEELLRCLFPDAGVIRMSDDGKGGTKQGYAVIELSSVEDARYYVSQHRVIRLDKNLLSIRHLNQEGEDYSFRSQHEPSQKYGAPDRSQKVPNRNYWMSSARDNAFVKPRHGMSAQRFCGPSASQRSDWKESKSSVEDRMVIIGNLPLTSTKESIRNLISNAQKVILKGPAKGSTVGSAFVEFATRREAIECLDQTHCLKVDKYVLSVHLVKPDNVPENSDSLSRYNSKHRSRSPVRKWNSSHGVDSDNCGRAARDRVERRNEDSRMGSTPHFLPKSANNWYPPVNPKYNEKQFDKDWNSQKHKYENSTYNARKYNNQLLNSSEAFNTPQPCGDSAAILMLNQLLKAIGGQDLMQKIGMPAFNSLVQTALNQDAKAKHLPASFSDQQHQSQSWARNNYHRPNSSNMPPYGTDGCRNSSSILSPVQQSSPVPDLNIVMSQLSTLSKNLDVLTDMTQTLKQNMLQQQQSLEPKHLSTQPQFTAQPSPYLSNRSPGSRPGNQQVAIPSVQDSKNHCLPTSHNNTSKLTPQVNYGNTFAVEPYTQSASGFQAQNRYNKPTMGSVDAMATSFQDRRIVVSPDDQKSSRNERENRGTSKSRRFTEQPSQYSFFPHR